jgi:hypothetical protein
MPAMVININGGRRRLQSMLVKATVGFAVIVAAVASASFGSGSTNPPASSEPKR